MSTDRPNVIVIAMNQALDNDAHLRRKMLGAEKRAKRQASRFPTIDLAAIQKNVNQNLVKLLLNVHGKYVDLLDLMNFLKNGRCLPPVTPENVTQFYSLANTVSLNGIYLYQYLSDAGFDPVVIQNYATANLETALDPPPLAVCISSNFMYMDDIREMATEIKALCPETSIIAGGMLVKKVFDPGEHLAPQALDYFSSFRGKIDAFVIEAQGEQTLAELLNVLREGGSMEQVPNLACFDANGKLVFTPRREEHLDMDQTAIKWDRVPAPYLRKSLPVNSSRGCFFRCRFCTYHWLFPEVHYKSLEILRQELRAINELGFVQHIRFTDDNFTANPKRLKRVLRMMIDESFDFTWSSFARASALTSDLIQMMDAAGCEFVDMGIESGSQSILDNMDKKLKREQAVNAIQVLNDYGIFSRGSFIVGFPGETEDTFAETIDLINESGLPYYHPYLFYYSRNTLVHQQQDSFGIQGLGLAWKHHTMDAAAASALMSQMVQRVEGGYTDGVNYIEEIYKLLRGDGYGPLEILELFRLRRELQLAADGSLPENSHSPEIEGVLLKLESLVR